MLVERAQRLLETHGVSFDTVTHRNAYTAQGVAAASHVSGWTLAKVLAIRTPSRGPVMVVLPASCRVDTGALAKALGEKSVSFISEVEMKELFPDCETGAMPPFGQLCGMRVWVDACFRRGRQFAFQAGNHHEIALISYEDFERLEHPQKAEFCLH
jgi:Ala-tRNA(Pro) deacylase